MTGSDDPVFVAAEAIAAAASGQPTNPARVRALADYRMTELRALGRRHPSPVVDALLRLVEAVREVADLLAVGDVANAERTLVEALAGVELDEVAT